MKKEKVILTYNDGEDYLSESIWAEPVGEYYRVKNIPFFASNIALDDIIKVEEEDGTLYFDELITASGNSVVQITFFEMGQFDFITKELEKLGCGWEGSHIPSLISVNIPKEVDYEGIRDFLDVKHQDGILDYKEACLGFH